MSRAAHPMFRRLVQAAGTHGQLLLRDQQLNLALKALGGGLGRVGFNDAPAWDRLLQSPWAEPRAGGALQALVTQLAQRDGASPEAAGLPRSQTPSIGADAAHVREPERQPAGSKPEPAARQTVRNPFAPRDIAARASVDSLNAAGDPGGATASAAWLQRARRAGLQEAFFTPIKMGRPQHTPVARRFELNEVPDAQPAPAAPVANAGTALFSARQGGLAWPASDEASPQSASAVLPRLNSVLDRIDRRSAMARPTGETPNAWRRAASPPAHDMAATEPGRIGTTAAQASSTATSVPAAIGSAAVGRTSGGLRGLAARAVAAQATSAWPVAAGTGTGASAADTTTASPMNSRTSDDEQLAEQFARVLRREAERDGIDVSDVMP